MYVLILIPFILDFYHTILFNLTEVIVYSNINMNVLHGFGAQFCLIVLVFLLYYSDYLLCVVMYIPILMLFLVLEH